MWGRDVSIFGVQTMNGPIVRLTKSSRPVQEYFFAAGITVVGVAVLQSIGILLVWMLSNAH